MNSALSREELLLIRGRLQAASDGPWDAMYEVAGNAAETSWFVFAAQSEDGAHICTVDGNNAAANAEFIAWARKDVERLLNAVERRGDAIE